MHEEDVRRLIRILEESDEIMEIEMASYPLGGKRIRISKRGIAAQAAAPAAAPAQVQAAPQPADAADDRAGLHEIKAPMVGTYYSSPSPDAVAFVQPGGRIAPGTVLCIIEAMKLMNEIESDMSGTVREVLVENGQAVEFGQPLFLIERS